MKLKLVIFCLSLSLLLTCSSSNKSSANLSVNNLCTSDANCPIGLGCNQTKGLCTSGNGSFTVQTVTYLVGTEPNSIAVADFNQDKNKDMAISNARQSSVSVLLGNGDGTFQTQVTYPTDLTSNPQFVASGDFNGDGYPDLVTANTGSSNISVLINKKDGTFKTQVLYSMGNLKSDPISIAIADVNKDTFLDIITANSGTNNVSVFLGKGDGTFYLGKGDGILKMPGAYTTNLAPSSIVISDISHDGNLDVATATRRSNEVSILLGNGDGTFQTNLNYTRDNISDPVSLVTGDFNNDGYLDIATANFHSNNISVSLGGENGIFQYPITYSVGTNPTSVATAYLNGNNALSLVTTNSGSDNISVLLGNGDGSFQSQVSYSTGTAAFPVFAAIADWNNDGKLDLAIANAANNNISILLSAGTVQCIVDSDCTGSNVDGCVNNSCVCKENSPQKACTNNLPVCSALGCGITCGTHSCLENSSCLGVSTALDPSGFACQCYPNSQNYNSPLCEASQQCIVGGPITAGYVCWTPPNCSTITPENTAQCCVTTTRKPNGCPCSYFGESADVCLSSHCSKSQGVCTSGPAPTPITPNTPCDLRTTQATCTAASYCAWFVTACISNGGG